MYHARNINQIVSQGLGYGHPIQLKTRDKAALPIRNRERRKSFQVRRIDARAGKDTAHPLSLRERARVRVICGIFTSALSYISTQAVAVAEKPPIDAETLNVLAGMDMQVGHRLQGVLYQTAKNANAGYAKVSLKLMAVMSLFSILYS
jgi:hypothetical protein